MDQKKLDKVNLDKVRQLFLSIGLLFITGVIFSAFTYRTYDKNAYDFIVEIEEELTEVPQFVQPQEVLKLAPPPPRQPISIEIEIVDDKADILENVLQEKENDNDVIENFGDLFGENEPDEGLDPIPFFSTSEMPYYSQCSGLKGKARDECTKSMIHRKVQKAFILPEIAKELGWEGTVIVQFSINKMGNVSNVKVLQGVNQVLDEAAVRAVKRLPRAHPGMEMDKPVLTYYSVPVKINFR